jgi:iron complex outermembrane receptor protein
MKKRLLCRIGLPMLILLSAYTAFAQQVPVSGKITDAVSGAGLGGVSVIPRGSTRGTVSAEDGSFSLSVDSKQEILVFSFVGFETREIAITGSFMNVTLSPSNNAMNEVVVVGYGTERKRDLTGSIVTVSEKDFQKGVITTPDQLISGKTAGVSIISNSGQPGSGSTIRIRGGSSLNASNDPLIVIDGVPMDNEGGVSGAGSALSFINPNDIESFTVLKDASASAIYGTRASNGVIIISTKKGKGGALRASLSSVNSVSTLTKKVPVLNADQFRQIVNADGTPAQVAMLGNSHTDWQDQVFQTGIGTDNNMSLSGGLKNFPYRVSIGYLNQQGILKTDKLERYSAALAINPMLLHNSLKLDLNIKWSKENTRFANTGAIGGAATFDPTQPVYSKSSRFGGYYEWLDPGAATGLQNLAGRNPLGLLEQTYNTSSPQRAVGNIQLDYKFPFLPGLHANLNAGFDLADGRGKTFVPDSAASAYIAGGTGGSNNPYRSTKATSLFEFYLNYARNLESIKSRIDLLAGYSYNDYGNLPFFGLFFPHDSVHLKSPPYAYANSTGLRWPYTFHSTNYFFPTFHAGGNKVPASDPAVPFDNPRHTLISYFGRLNYTFKDRYLLTATLRDDASSRFGPSNRHALFPSVALAWKINEEPFLNKVQVLSDLKLRLGYGITGQQDGIANYAYKAVYDLSSVNGSYQFGNNYYQGYRPEGYNPSLKWEQTTTYNAGIDFGFLDNRITGSVDVYEKKTSDLLNRIPQPAGSNFSAFFLVNVGSMTNKGVEFNINAQPIQTRNLNWDVSFNITYNENRITRLTVIPGDTNYIGFPSGNIAGGIGGQFAFMNSVGSPKNSFYLFQQVYDQSGKPIEGVFVDRNGDGIINQEDMYLGKSADPKMFLGFSTSLNYKKWYLGLVLRGSFGNYDYNNIWSQTGNLNQILGNSVLYNTSTSYLSTGFKGGNGQQLLSDYWIQNASFLRMDNINIGYNLGKLYHSEVTLRLSASVQNVFVITKYQGLDPEIAANASTSGNPGIDNNLYPRPRIYALGVNLGF